MTGSKKYRLYVCRPEDISDSEKYYLITSSYCLLYTNRKPPEKHKEVSNPVVLPELAKKWLNDCIEDIRGRYLTENQNEVLEKAKSFNERFAAELAVEREQMRKEGTVKDNGE